MPNPGEPTEFVGILERTTRFYETTILMREEGDDPEDLEPIPLVQISEVKLTLYVEDTLQVINGRQQQDVKNSNDVEIDDDGNLSWSMQPEDNAIVNPELHPDFEWHVALFEWITVNDVHGKHRVRFQVKNCHFVPPPGP